jgi:hypothetical protein
MQIPTEGVGALGSRWKTCNRLCSDLSTYIDRVGHGASSAAKRNRIRYGRGRCDLWGGSCPGCPFIPVVAVLPSPAGDAERPEGSVSAYRKTCPLDAPDMCSRGKTLRRAEGSVPVLVIDDEEAARRAVTQGLREAGFTLSVTRGYVLGGVRGCCGCGGHGYVRSP